MREVSVFRTPKKACAKGVFFSDFPTKLGENFGETRKPPTKNFFQQKEKGNLFIAVVKAGSILCLAFLVAKQKTESEHFSKKTQAKVGVSNFGR